MSQFSETNTTQTTCPICGKEVPARNVHNVRNNKPNYCSRVCASQGRYSTRYRGSGSGPMDRPTLQEKTKL